MINGKPWWWWLIVQGVGIVVYVALTAPLS
jgi:hypothetical protein